MTTNKKSPATRGANHFVAHSSVVSSMGASAKIGGTSTIAPVQFLSIGSVLSFIVRPASPFLRRNATPIVVQSRVLGPVFARTKYAISRFSGVVWRIERRALSLMFIWITPRGGIASLIIARGKTNDRSIKWVMWTSTS